jgi:hypothetical protein
VSPIDQSTLGTLPRRRIYAFSWPTERREAVPDKEARLPGVQHSRLADVRRFSITMLRGRLGSVTLSGLAVLPGDSGSSSNNKTHAAKLPVLGMVAGFACYFISFLW